jgi:hypothetical protein
VKLTTHLHLVPRSKNEWSYTFTPPIRLHGVVLNKSTGTNLPLPFKCNRMSPQSRSWRRWRRKKIPATFDSRFQRIQILIPIFAPYKRIVALLITLMAFFFLPQPDAVCEKPKGNGVRSACSTHLILLDMMTVIVFVGSHKV